MFMQIINGPVKDSDLLLRQHDRWQAEIKPTVTGYLGSTGGVTGDGRAVWLVRFESAEAAAANSRNALQDAWWNETAKAYDGEPAFHDCTDVDTYFGGGSNDAGFVQVIQGSAKDAAGMRRWINEHQDDLRGRRPDIVGLTLGWHGDGGFTQAVYFRSEADARREEQAGTDDEMSQSYLAQFASPPTFYDLTSPRLD